MLWVCNGCGTAYSVDAPRCPQCASTEHVEEGADDMPKITVHGGPSIEGADEAEGGEQSSPGTTSSTSSKKDATTPETSENAPAKPARTTGNRSGRARTGASTARGTDGDQTAPTSDKN